jgi:uncharacterized protein YqiB (DUF1249 family)
MSETCRVLFQIKFDELVYLVGFVIRMYHDARSSECQNYGYIRSYFDTTQYSPFIARNMDNIKSYK